jgi:ribosome biogenesis GTPase / thiamine phosphate phosphatase
LAQWGWTEDWANEWSKSSGFEPARILAEQRDYLEVITASGPQRAEIKGRMRKHDDVRPTVGDWVILNADAQIESVLPRRTCLRRKAAGETEEIQILATNIDWVFITTSLNKDFNPRRIERFLVAARDSQAKVALIFTKSDLGLMEVKAAKALLEDRLNDIELITTSSKTGDGISHLRSLIKPSDTAVFLGTSGVGKSSLVNALLQDETQVVSEARSDDDKGRHTTTGRTSFLIPGGGVIIDSPGIRELQLADGTIKIEEEFDDIESLALNCKFTNCRHENEKGCAIRTALSENSLSVDRLESYRKLKAEIEAKAKRKPRVY